jgi:NAD(P)H-dependent FMN reductase
VSEVTPVLKVIVASTRPTRIGRSIGDWFVETARTHGGFAVELVDLKDVALPLLDEPGHPVLGQYAHDHTKAWSAIVAEADAFVFVMPEYNHGYTAPLKNALDFLSAEWRNKAAGFVSYGGVSGGLRAVQSLKPVLQALRMVPVVDQVVIPMAPSYLVDGRFEPSDMITASAGTMLDELKAQDQALRVRRG